VINSNLGLISHHYKDTASYRPKITNFAYPLSFSALVRGHPLGIYEKALQFLKLVFQAADGEDLEILAWTVFAWSTRVTDRRTDRRTELRWLRRAESIAAFARKKQEKKRKIILFSSTLTSGAGPTNWQLV